MQTGKSLNKPRVVKIVSVTVAMIVIMVTVRTYTSELPSFAEVKKSYSPSDIWVVDKNGIPLETVRMGTKERSLDWVSWSEVSPSFKDKLIQTEDQRFFQHHGVDILALFNAIKSKIMGQHRGGASTISMQLIGQLGKHHKRQSYTQKYQQILSAIALEMKWSKEEILEAYINLLPMRGELVGLRAASMGIFKKNPSGLFSHESSILVALIRAPNAISEIVAKRACLIEKNMNCESLSLFTQESLSRPYSLPRRRELVPVLAEQFMVQSPSKSVLRTTLDARVQALSMNQLREQLQNLRFNNVQDGAILVLETKTGKVVSYVANAGSGIASAVQVDGIQALRQAGSTIKPFVYGTTFEWDVLQSNSLLEDSPADITISDGRVYHPRNYDHTFRGLVSVGEALGSSINVPAVRALQLIGQERILEKLRAFGFKNLQNDDYYGPSLALGAVDVSLWELTNAYRQLAIENSPFSNKSRRSIQNILSSSENRRFTFGMDSVLTLPFPAAVKTGTSKDMRDNWCVGWTSEYTIGVWIGNFNGDPMWNVSGMSGAAPIWRNLMIALHPNPKAQLSLYETPAEPLPNKTITKILYPAKDMLVGLDPDIPIKLQKLPIEIENPQKGHKLFLNDKLLNKATETILWQVERGKYKVDLRAENGETIDSLRFEVR